jgi:hypothetical protein
MNRTLVEHWDGRSWSIVPSPNLNDGSILRSVSAVSPTDVWAVGAAYIGFGEISSSRALIEHWDGVAWAIVPGPKTPGGQTVPGVVETVAAIAPDAVWVGWGQEVFEWDGNKWLARTAVGRILALAAQKPTEVWAAGDKLARWSGGKWTAVPIEPKLPKGSTFNGMAVTRSGNVWTVGGLGFAEGHQHPFSLRLCASRSPGG